MRDPVREAYAGLLRIVGGVLIEVAIGGAVSWLVWGVPVAARWWGR